MASSCLPGGEWASPKSLSCCLFCRQILDLLRNRNKDEITHATDVYLEMTIKNNYQKIKGGKESLRIPCRFYIREEEREGRGPGSLQQSSKAGSARMKGSPWAKISSWRTHVSQEQNCIRTTSLPSHWWGEVFGKDDHNMIVVMNLEKQQLGHQSVIFSVAYSHGFHRCCLMFSGKLFRVSPIFPEALILSN